MDLFDYRLQKEIEGVPLAERMRPRMLGEIAGQQHLVGTGKLLETAIRTGQVPSMILWGPPGSGKTTLARVLARDTSANFITFSAVLGGVAELRKAVDQAVEQRRLYGRGTILFIDEIHRFNKAQQDALLPHVERGTVTLVGATTENPSFAINAALLSRARVFRLDALAVEELLILLRRALADHERGLGGNGLEVEDQALEAIAAGARGDARRALDVLDTAARFALAPGRGNRLDVGAVQEALASGTLLYDKSGEEHYNVVSAFIKSMRGSDPDAAVYWMMRMLEAGDDPLFVSRRMIIFSSEDIGNADPRALQVAIAADAAVRRLGMPEAIYALSQCCLYLASVPKSNASYLAWAEAQKDIREYGALDVPLKLRNPVTTSMKEWGYGQQYRYPHDEGGYAAGETYLPEQLVGRTYYRPKQIGFEVNIGDRLNKLHELRRNSKS
jgi:putative ATPase